MRIVFFGSPDFAVPSLRALFHAGHEFVGVVSQPAKPAGRGKKLQEPAVISVARELGLETFQPATLSTDAAFAWLEEKQADVFVVVAYGKILKPRVLELPRLGCINVHGSLLPRFRGASPVQAALLAGDSGTGVSIMRMDAGMDTGGVYATEATSIGERETAGELSVRLAAIGAALLVATLPGIASGALEPVPQPSEGATLCPKIRREDGHATFREPAELLVRKARAYDPWPGLFTFRAGVRVKLLDLTVAASEGPPGTVIEAGERVVVACEGGAVAVSALQSEGKRALAAAEFVRGERVVAGEVWA